MPLAQPKRDSPSHLCHAHSAPAASLFASHFRVVMRARPQRVQSPTCLEVKNRSARLCICARNLEVLTRRR